MSTRLEPVPATGPSVAAAPRLTVGSDTNDPKKPDFRCAFHRDQSSRWHMAETLLGGTEQMRAAGETYLPRFTKEEESNWKRRLQAAVLLNYFRKTVMGYSGKPFGKPLQIPDDLDERITHTLEDVDGTGTDFNTFAQRGFEKGVAKGIIHAYIDFPTLPEGATAEDEANVNPEVTLIDPEALIGARQGADGKLEQIRIYECVTVPDGEFGEKTVERVRVIERTVWAVYEREKTSKRWKRTSDGANSLGEIPLVTFYAECEGFMRSRPPLIDLAYKNIEHWQSASDQRNVLTIARFPMLVGYGVNPADPITIGPNTFIGFRDPQSGLRFVEHGGAAINAGRQDLEDIKAEMAVLGLTLLLPQQSGAPTATAKAMDGAESVTELQKLVQNYENFLNEIVYWIARWYDINEDDAYKIKKVHINQDYAKLLNLDAGVNALLSVRSSGDISRKAMIDALKRRNILPVDFDPDDDAEELAEEKSRRGEGMPLAKSAQFGVIEKQEVQGATDEK